MPIEEIKSVQIDILRCGRYCNDLFTTVIFAIFDQGMKKQNLPKKVYIL